MINVQSTLHPPTTREAAFIDQTAKVVCAKCNNGWMHDLEDAARPLLSPLMLARGRHAFDDYALAIIGSWAIKGAMVFEHTTRKGAGRYYTQDERFRFADEESGFEPPPGTYVWVAQYAGRRAAHSTIQNLNLHSKDGTTRHQIQAITVSFRHFLFQVLAGRWPDGIRPDLRELERVWGSVTLQLWPGIDDLLVRWPPPAYLSDDTLEAFTDRFDRRLRLVPGS